MSYPSSLMLSCNMSNHRCSALAPDLPPDQSDFDLLARQVAAGGAGGGGTASRAARLCFSRAAQTLTGLGRAPVQPGA